jgi:hypothetical protein
MTIIRLQESYIEPSNIFSDFKNVVNVTKNKKKQYEIEYEGKKVLMTWMNVKRIQGELLQIYNNFRSAYVDNLLKKIAQQIQCTRFCVANSVGSTTITSDYDITLTGPFAYLIIKYFNEHFRNEFNAESGEIFDTNLYGTTFLFFEPISNYKKYSTSLTKKPINCEFVINTIDTGNSELDIKNQHHWAYISIILSIFSSSLQVSKQNDLEFINMLYKNINDTNRQLLEYALQAFKKLTTRKHQKIDYNNIHVMNEHYEQNVKETAKAKNVYEQSDNITNAYINGIDLKNKISVTNFYGSETYICQGTIFHVVGRLQSNYDGLDITLDEYYDSFLENYGKVLKEFYLTRTDSISFFILTCIKYLHRMFDALVKFNPKYIDYATISSVLLKYKTNRKMNINYILNVLYNSIENNKYQVRLDQYQINSQEPEQILFDSYMLVQLITNNIVIPAINEFLK